MPRKAKAKPAVDVKPYQQRWIADKARFSIALKARQIGFTWGTALGVLLSCLDAEAKGQREKWYWLSAGERQAKEAIEAVQTHCDAIKVAAKSFEENILEDGASYKQLVVELPGGSRIVGLPANPRTARGSSGNVILDEFAFHQDARAIWRAMYPVVTRGGYKLRVMSTPNGKSGMFYEIWTHAQGWSRHRVDIYDAVKDGLELDIEQLKEGIGNADDWAQEYECGFLDEAHAWIPYDLLDAAEDLGATEELPEGFTAEGPLFLGVDIGRKKDLTVLWLIERLGDVSWTRSVKVLERTPFRDQIAAVEALMPMVRRCCVDATGMGMPLAEQLQEKYGSKVEGVTFSALVKEDLATHLRQSYEDRKVRIPFSAEIRKDVHSVKKLVTSAGNIRFDADHTDAGHADRFWAQSLAEHAVGEAWVTPSVDTIERSGSDGLFKELGRFHDTSKTGLEDMPDWMRI